MVERALAHDSYIVDSAPIARAAEDASNLPTLLPITEPPLVLGTKGAISVWAAALAVARSLYS